FLKSQNHFMEQEILACEGDIISKIETGLEIVHDFEQEGVKYQSIDILNVNFALQDFHLYRANIKSFESDFENIYNQRKLIEPINLFANIKTKNLRNLQNSSIFSKNEILID